MNGGFSAIARNISALMDDRGITQSAIAAVAGVTPGAMSSWVSGRNRPRHEHLERVAEYYGISVDDLVSERDGLYAKMHGLSGAPDGALAPARPRRAYLPLHGRVHAGTASEPEPLQDRVPIPYEVWDAHRSAYFLEVEGDCMDKVYPEGCYVLVDPDREPQDRSIAVVSIDGADYVMRRLMRGADTLLLSPESTNPKWKDIVVHSGDGTSVEFVGTVVWFQASDEMP